MKKLQRQKGFTLVELAIVLTIIGLLIGGILKGQALIANAQVTSQMAQFKAVEAAATTFNDQYAALPGDMIDAGVRLSATGCGGTVCLDGDGNGVVGAADAAPTATGAYAAGTAGENMGYWEDLSAANLIAGISSTALTFGGGLPQGKLTGSGLIATTITAAPYGGGVWVTLTSAPSYPAVTAAGMGVMTPNQAAQIDRKMDDGQALTGSVIGSGFTTCTGVPAAGSSGYTEGVTSKDCTISYKAQN